MITLHHLNHSRSQRIVWLLEELGVDYQIVPYHRDSKTRLAPPELEDIHPLGKSPVVTDGDLLLHESAAITAHLIDKYGDGKLAPITGSDDFAKYQEWLHYAEGSVMLPLMLHLYTGRLGDAAAPLMPRIDSETKRHFSFVNSEMAGKEFFVGDTFSGADIMMSFPFDIAKSRGFLDSYGALSSHVDRMQARPAYQSAIKKSDEYSIGYF
jgi:glutathione S-transferase